MWQLKNSNCDKPQNFKTWQIKNLNCDQTKNWKYDNSKIQIVTKPNSWENSKFRIVTKHKNSNCDKTPNPNFDKTQKLKYCKLIFSLTLNSLLVRTSWNLDTRWDVLWAAVYNLATFILFCLLETFLNTKGLDGTSKTRRGSLNGTNPSSTSMEINPFLNSSIRQSSTMPHNKL